MGRRRARERIDTMIDAHVCMARRDMDTKADPTLHRVLLSKEEFKRAMDFIEAARRHDVGSIEYEALLHSAIIFYARPFFDNERSGTKGAKQLTGIDPAQVLGADIVLHQHIKTLRKKVVAHSEAAYNPAQHIPLAIGDSKARGFGFAGKMWHVTHENIDLDAFARIAKAMYQACLPHVFNVADALGRVEPGPHPG
jgi:hypothetical protein